MHGFYTFLMFLSKRCRYAMINLSYKLYFRHFNFQVRRTHAYPHKKALIALYLRLFSNMGASSSPLGLLLRGAPDTARILCRCNRPEYTPARIYPGLKRPRLDYTRVYYGLGQFIPRGILWPRPIYTSSGQNIPS